MGGYCGGALGNGGLITGTYGLVILIDGAYMIISVEGLLTLGSLPGYMLLNY